MEMAMLKYTSLILVGLFGCVDDGFQLNLEHTGPHASVYDDGTTLRVTGCTDGATFGCNTPAFGETMTVTTGGIGQDVPQSSDGAIDDQLIGLFRDGPFQLTLARPADAQLGIALAGTTAQVALPPAFSIDPVPAALTHRDSLTITHEVLPGATTWGLIISTCGSRTHTDLIEEMVPGELVVEFAPSLVGICAHEIHVDQRTHVAGPELGVDTIRIARVTVTSNP
jgi:hypothetical protein